MYIFKKIFVSVFSFLIIFNFSFAEENISSRNTTLPVNISILNPQIIPEDNNNFNINFSLKNNKNIQLGIQYGVRLSYKDKDGNLVLVDEKRYDDLLNLKEDELVNKEFVYSAPDNLNGTYDIFIIVSGKNSLPFSVFSLGEVKLKSDKGIFMLNPNDCYLSISGEKDKKYSLDSRIDINKEELLLAKCSISNISEKTLTLYSFFEIYKNNGSLLKNTENTNNQDFVFKGKEKKDVTINLPKVTDPGVYRIRFGLGSGDIKTNLVDAYFVLQGQNAYIKNVFIDKDYYQKGETANIGLIWEKSLDNYKRGGSTGGVFETKIKLSILDKNNNLCIEPYEDAISPDYFSFKNNIPVTVIKNCLNPKIILSLTDNNNLVLDELNYQVETTKNTKNYQFTKILGFSILGLFILIIVFFILKKNGKIKF